MRNRILRLSHSLCTISGTRQANETDWSRRCDRTHRFWDHSATPLDGEDRTRETWGTWWWCSCELCQTRTWWWDQVQRSDREGRDPLFGYHPSSWVCWDRTSQQHPYQAIETDWIISSFRFAILYICI
mgnify:CR=1 FL=1